MLPKSQHPPVDVEHGNVHGLVPQQAAPEAAPQQVSGLPVFSGVWLQHAAVDMIFQREKIARKSK